MKSIKEFILRYEEIIINHKYNLKRKYMISYYLKVYGKAAIALLGMIVVTFGVGYLFQLLGNLNYLIFIGTLIVIGTFLFSKTFSERAHKKAIDGDYKIRLVLYVETIYLLVTVLSASLFLQLTVFIRALSISLLIVSVVFFGISLLFYTYMYYQTKKIDIPNPLRLIVNGLLFGIMFYAVTALIQIEQIALSMTISVIIAFFILLIRLYVVKYFLIKYRRLAVALLGFFLILLSFPFNRAFNYASFYRGEFSFRILYETLMNEEMQLPEDINGEVILYDDYIVVVDSAVITFFNHDLDVVYTFENEYEAVYIMNDRLLANKVSDMLSSSVDVYEFSTDEFQLLGDFYAADPSEHIVVEEDAYISNGGYIYKKEAGSEGYELLPSIDDEEPVIYNQQDNFIVFDYYVPVLATRTSFQDEVRGNVYENVAYHNGHMIFINSQIYVIQKAGYVDPEDDGKVIVYLADVDEYMNDKVLLQPSFELPSMFKITEFYYENNQFYLIGHEEYSTGNYNNMIYIFNSNGEFEKELIYDGSNIAISDEYIIYGEDEIRVYSSEAPTELRYRFLKGYGITFFTIVIVSAFSMERVFLKPHRKIKKEAKSIENIL